MKTIESTHTCFNCNNSFKWQGEIRESRNGAGAFTVMGEQAKIAFIAKNDLRITVKCSKCMNDNQFDHPYI